MGETQAPPPGPTAEVSITDIVVRQSAKLLFLKVIVVEAIFAGLVLIYLLFFRFFTAGLLTVYFIDLTIAFFFFFDVLLRTALVLSIVALWIDNAYIFKKDRLIFSRGILFPSETDINYGLITGVDVRPGFFGRLLNYGTLVLFLAGRPPVDVPDVPDPFRYEKLLEDILPFKQRLEFVLTKEGRPKRKEPFSETSRRMKTRRKD